jgi:putative peptidoglycan lipid II flippase
LPAFRTTLQQGLRLVIVLMVPAAIGLFVLADPIVALLFEHGDFGPSDTLRTAAALRLYLLGMVFAAIDQPLIFAFYARQDTWTPALVGVVGVLVYLLCALPLLALWGYLGLVLASSLQLTTHALIMLWLLQRRLQGLEGGGLVRLTGRTVGATLAMGAATWACLVWLPLWAVPVWPGAWLLSELLRVLIPAMIGALVYALAALLLGIDEAWAGVALARRKLRV